VWAVMMLMRRAAHHELVYKFNFPHHVKSSRNFRKILGASLFFVFCYHKWSFLDLPDLVLARNEGKSG
jgi:hypothetical protein